MAFELNSGQKAAVLTSVDWYFSGSITNNLFIVNGVGGSGKTSMIYRLVEVLGLSKLDVLYVAFTGKAVSVMRFKKLNAYTIHKAFYSARKIKGKVYFKKKQTLPPNVKLIVIDEFSMVGDTMIKDILSFGIPTIALGDSMQLGPVMAKNTFLVEDKFDVFLTEIMRTDDQSGIIELSTKCRNREILQPGHYGRSRVITKQSEMKDVLEYDAILCWKNATRRELNMQIREMLGLTGKYPKKGEKVVILANNYEHVIEHLGIELFAINGLVCIMLEDTEIVDTDTLHMRMTPEFIYDKSKFFDVDVSRAIFDSYYEPAPDTSSIIMSSIEAGFDFVYVDMAFALTISKSQGSEYLDVLVISEMPKWNPQYFRHLYTGITRAQNSVDILI